MEELHPVEQSVADLIIDFRYEDISKAAFVAVSQLLEDQLALQIGCTNLEWNQTVLNLMKGSHAPGSSHITMADYEGISAGDAAFVNATYGHSFEYDDHHPSASHPGSAVISAAIALGEELNSDMSDVIVGIVAGYEVYARIGNLVARQLLTRGFHPHPILSTFGAAAVVCKMKNFDATTTLNALAIATSHASGLTEYTSSGGSIKRVHSGIGTRSGIQAAELAHAGITGPTSFLTGPKGFLKSFAQVEANDEMATNFNRDKGLEIERFWLKPYCCCGINHAYIDAARLLNQNGNDIATVELGIQPSGDVIVGNSNAHAFEPRQIDHLQYSLPFQFSMSYLGYGNGFSTHLNYLNGKLDLGPDSEVAQLAKKITLKVDPKLEEKYPDRWVGDVTIRYVDGRRRQLSVDKPTGTQGNRLTAEALDSKFRDLTEDMLDAQASVKLLETIKSPNPQGSCREFAKLLQRTTPSEP